MEGYYEEYWERRKEEKHLQEMPRHRLVARLVETNIPRGGSVLELGAGEGHTLVRLAGKFRLSCCDISRAALDLINVAGVRKVQCDLNNAFPFSGEKFDAVICTEVLEHLLRPERLLVEVKKSLALRGIMVVSLPNTAHLEYRWTLLRGRFPRFDGSHLHFWTVRDFLDLCNDQGFQVSLWEPSYYDFWVFRTILRGPFAGVVSRSRAGRELFGREMVFLLRPAAKDAFEPGVRA